MLVPYVYNSFSHLNVPHSDVGLTYFIFDTRSATSPKTNEPINTPSNVYTTNRKK